MSLGSMLSTMAPCFLSTCLIFFFTLIFSLPLGIVFALLRMSKNKVISSIIRFIVSVLRGTPLLLQLLVVNFGPWYLFGVPTAKEKLIPIVIAFSINYAAYFSEIYRGGIESIANGQYEAAAILGYSKFQTFIRIVLPQVIKIILPSVTNEIVTLVKDTSLASTLSYYETYKIAAEISNSNVDFTPFVVAGVFYYVFNFIVATVMNKAEKALSYYKI